MVCNCRVPASTGTGDAAGSMERWWQVGDTFASLPVPWLQVASMLWEELRSRQLEWKKEEAAALQYM